MGIDYQPEPTAIHTDVLVVGSGPIGAIYVRKLVEAGHHVLMIDAGAQETEIPGEHKNTPNMKLNEFTNVIKNDLTPLSSSLPAASATLAVGGMSTHWTCVTPTPHPTLEAPKVFTQTQWTELLNEAQGLLNTNSTIYATSSRQQGIQNLLNTQSGRDFAPTPIACTKDNNGNIIYSSTSTILSPILNNPKFTLLPNHLCTNLQKTGGVITAASITDVSTNTQKLVKAKQYILAAGAVLTPQIIYNSGMQEQLPALGRYLTERVVTFCQVKVKKELLKDGGINVMEGVKEGREWVTMINREAHQYGQLPENVDDGSVLDIRCMSGIEPNPNNRVDFDGTKGTDGMPLPAFTVTPSNSDLKRAAKMMLEMQTLATSLGTFITEPKIMPLGTALHLSGTTRAGTSPADSVVDANSKVWGVENLYLGGCGVISEGMSCSPTLTAAGYAVNSAREVAVALVE